MTRGNYALVSSPHTGCSICKSCVILRLQKWTNF